MSNDSNQPNNPANTITGTPGNDTLTGTPENDRLIGNAGNDRLEGGAGADHLDGGLGADHLDGGAGIDTASYAGSSAALRVNLLSENGLGGDAQGDRLTSIENLVGSRHNDHLLGDTKNNVLEGGAGADQLDGGRGNDTASYAGSSLAVTVNLATGSALGGDAQGDQLISIENLIGSDYGDTLTGDTRSNILEGGAGADRLDGGAGADRLDGGAGADRLDGGAGADRLDGGAGADRLDGGEGADQLDGGEGADRLDGGEGADQLDGGEGNDTASYAGSSMAVTVDLNTGKGLGGDAEGDQLTSIENLIGSGYDDILLGGSKDNILEGGAGADRFSGGAGIDTASYSGSSVAVTVNLATGRGSGGDAQGDILKLIENFVGSDHDDRLTGDKNNNILEGGAGDDRLVGGAGDDHLDGGEGSDTASYAGSSEAVRVNLATGSVAGGDATGDRFTSIENLIGSRYNDILTGDSGDNILEGGAGADELEGAGGSDTASYAGSSAAVRVNLSYGRGDGGDAQGDRLISIESLIGSDHDDTLVGDAGNNILDGSAGDDQLNGGAGDDTLTGGLGADTYVFHLGTGGVISETDRYDTGQDIIDNTGRSRDGDRILITEGISQQDIWFSQNGDDLQIDVIGADDSVTVRDWFVGATNRVDYVQLGEGDGSSFLQSGNVQALVDAMSSFDPPASGEPTDLTAEEQTGIDTVVAAQWHNELVTT